MPSRTSPECFLRLHIGARGKTYSSDTTQWFQLCVCPRPPARIDVDQDICVYSYLADTPGTSTFVFEFNTLEARSAPGPVPVELRALEAMLRVAVGNDLLEKVV